MNGQLADKNYSLIKKHKIVSIVRGNLEVDQIIPLSKALYDGGINIIEITCNSPGVFEMIASLSKEMGENMLVGAGTVTDITLCKKVLDAGAKFIVAPDTNLDVVNYCLDSDICVVPGALTPTEILNVKRLGAKMVKVFPAGLMGTKYIKDIRGPINDFDFMATGGIDIDNISEFLEAGCSAFGIGGSLVKKEFIQNYDWDGLQKLAKEFLVKIS